MCFDYDFDPEHPQVEDAPLCPGCGDLTQCPGDLCDRCWEWEEECDAAYTAAVEEHLQAVYSDEEYEDEWWND